MRNKKIGVFDSGFGGLTVLKEILTVLPQYSYIYLGDSARAPYGSRSKQTIYSYARQAVDFLILRGCELIIFACNTVSAEALRKIQREYLPQRYPEKRVLGVIIPSVEYVFEKGNPKRIGVIGTEGTVKSRTYVKEIKKISPETRVYQNACPMLVPLIEKGNIKSDKMNKYLDLYLAPLLKKKIDVLLLGCTHYALLHTKIKKFLGKDIKIISQSKIVAEKLAEYLVRHPEIEKKLSRENNVKYLTTASEKNFDRLAFKILKMKVISIKVKICES